jgi:recombinational DNA repair protein (RecF pathway)
LGALQAAVREMLLTIQNLEQEGFDMEHSRRFLLQMLEAIGMALSVAPQELLCSSTVAKNRQGQITAVSASTIENLAPLTQQYRSLHRGGLAIEDGLRSHT